MPFQKLTLAMALPAVHKRSEGAQKLRHDLQRRLSFIVVQVVPGALGGERRRD